MGCRLFSFITLSMSSHSLWLEEFLLKDQMFSLWRSPCGLIVFPLMLLIFVLCVWSSLLWLICVLCCFTLGLSYLGLSGFLDMGGYFLPHFKEVFNYYLLKYFLMAFLFVFFLWDSYDLNVGEFNIVPEVSEVVLISFNYFFFSASFISTILSSTSLIPSSASVILLVPSRVLLISVMHYSLLNDSFLFLLDPC